MLSLAFVRPLAFAIALALSTLTLASPGAVPLASTTPSQSPGRAVRHGTVARVSSVGSALGPAALRFGRSLGSPTEGHLLGGAHVEPAAYLRVVPVYEPGDARWGLEPLVSMIDRAARQVRRLFPEAITSVGHLSREGGGEIERHHSHESGRDADISFFVRSPGGKQLLASRFVQFRGDGAAPSWPGAFFDDAKNWALVAAMVTDPEAHVTHVFVASPLRARLLAFAERAGAPAGVRLRAAEVLQQPHGALPHDDHFHVRIGCPPHMSGCVENPAPRPLHPTSPFATRRRRGVPARGLVTPAPTQALPAARPAPPPLAPVVDEPGPEPDAPPAAMPAPIDDVDG
jgi:penicillin-insensitive murein endopeptidase